MSKLLIVEDDPTLGNSLKQYLEDENYIVALAKSIGEANEYFKDNDKADLIILDWMLPDGQGVDWLREIRSKKYDYPVIMLTARDETIDKVLGLESGANDYMTKPFEPRELIARIRVQLRNPSSTESGKEKIVLDNLVIDLTQREVTFNNNLVEMTKMEFNFLVLLADEPNRAFSREEILNKVWGYENYPSTRTVDTHVLQLRQKLFDDLIETVRGVGYRLRFKANN